MSARRFTMVMVVSLLLFAACSGGAPTDTGQATRLGNQPTDGATATGKAKKEALKEAEKVAKKAGVPGATGGGRSKAAGAAPAGGGRNDISSAIDPSLARRSASVDDAATDAQKSGVTPGYAEITNASIQGLGDDFRMTLTVNGQTPQEMPTDKTHWIIAFGITGANENEGYSFGAQCTEDGWQAYAGGRDDSGGEFPGTFFARDNKIIMTVPWEYIAGPREFEWYAASNWFTQLANQTHYSVDLVPNKDLAKFPN